MAATGYKLTRTNGQVIQIPIPAEKSELTRLRFASTIIKSICGNELRKRMWNISNMNFQFFLSKKKE